jgi:hypothetical protein
MSEALLDHLWQSTLFACAPALLTLAFRGNATRFPSSGLSTSRSSRENAGHEMWPVHATSDQVGTTSAENCKTSGP